MQFCSIIWRGCVDIFLLERNLYDSRVSVLVLYIAVYESGVRLYSVIINTWPGLTLPRSISCRLLALIS